MQEYFYELADILFASLKGEEVLLCGFSAEESDFVRLNRGRVRQAGTVKQADFSMDLIKGNRHAKSVVTLSAGKESDAARLLSKLKQLKEALPHLPEDPYLTFETEVKNTEQCRTNDLPETGSVVSKILEPARDRDMVGLYAQGGIYSGFSNSLGQRNWYATYSFNLDWSLYLKTDKAVKTNYAGYAWSDEEFLNKFQAATRQLEVLDRRPKTIKPGSYRVYLAPTAMKSFMEMLSWGGFSAKSHRTKTTPLLKMINGEAAFSPEVTMREKTSEGITPNFQPQGFLRPPEVVLIQKGKYNSPLVSPRSSKEYSIEPNGASADEAPHSLDMEGGQLEEAEVLSRLGTGIYVNQTWYLNYSDRPACRITGMTRFATFWVQNGRIAAPLNVMRFDESLYRAFGENLAGLTRHREFLPSSSTYGGRSTKSARLPGAVIEDFAFTL